MAGASSKQGHTRETDGAAFDATECSRTHEALAQSEGRFRVLIENSSDLVSMIDGAGTVQFQSSSSESILGYRPEELVGRSAFTLVHPDDLQMVRRVFAQMVQGQRERSQ